ncbi:unnamed protein product [Vitrella brassicaformis CCMP3155]|uniref:Glycosyl transferase 64 domain-containing protein n=1 Tax=Vitrella brassicaformis (strain CCMP3155) TaxID=1169540 RepID=A0A0G4FLM7_VITBC|nr:unnamed protein product [Vitrella brassicaformis CCMP3155]|eukprot:CEM14826.1 unnamed protein product [Vitrella brassicaformis CCMP3155]
MTSLVDSLFNCDDLYTNALVTYATSLPPLAVNVTVHRSPLWAQTQGGAMWVLDTRWREHRRQCIQKINDYFLSKPVLASVGKAAAQRPVVLHGGDGGGGGVVVDTGTVFKRWSRVVECAGGREPQTPVG